MAQALLHHCEHILVPPAFGVEDPRRAKTGERKPRREQVAAAERPEDRPLQTRGDARDEQGRGRIVAELRPRAGDLVQRTDRKPAARQPRIHCLHPERQALA